MVNTAYFDVNRGDQPLPSTSSSDLSEAQLRESLREGPSPLLCSGICDRIGAMFRPNKITSADIKKFDNNLIQFSDSKLKIATENFRHQIGKGGSGVVYKGTLSDGREIAVKKSMGTSEANFKEFLNELRVLSALHHRNLVKLYGFHTGGDDTLLIYEYLQNGSLSEALHRKTIQLDWNTRYNICLGIAKGLAYLHEDSMPRVIHRDVKPSNVLLGRDLNPKISDFGVARHFDEEEAQGVGTVGYLDPEYFQSEQLTEKVDVYSFGVTALEILSGRKAIVRVNGELKALSDLAKSLYENNRALELVDPSLLTFDKYQAIQMLEVALMCIQTIQSSRPPMSHVVVMLMRSSVSEQISFPTDGTSVFPMSTDHNNTLQLASNSFMGDGADLSHPLGSPTLEDIDDAELREVKDLLISFTHDEIRVATADFSASNKLGQGGFGPVYKGILSDEREIAVKKLSVTSQQGNSQYLADIQTISAVKHHNIVKLYGYCIENENRILVYEYLANKSLDLALFGKSALHLYWTTRHSICLGIARGLAYFHEESETRIIHGDVKSSNILLDNDLNPKISNFGLAKLFCDTKTDISTQFEAQLKADVYAFGVVALEILCGRPVNDSRFGPRETYLLELVWSLYEEDRTLELVDPTLESLDKEDAVRMFGIALLCTQSSPKMRPKMSQVVGMLTGASEVTVAEKPSYLLD